MDDFTGPSAPSSRSREHLDERRGAQKTRGRHLVEQQHDIVTVHRDSDEAVHPDIADVLVSADRIQTRLRELAAAIDRDYAGHDSVLLVGVLKGAFIVMADLARYVTVPIQFDFMAVSSYGSATQTSGVVRILKDLDIDIAGQHVLVVEDIVDSGLTLNYLLRNLRARGPASLEVFTLLSKPDQISVEIPLRYRGFEVPNVFVVGYGLDYAERYRHLPYVGTLRPDVYRESG